MENRQNRHQNPWQWDCKQFFLLFTLLEFLHRMWTTFHVKTHILTSLYQVTRSLGETAETHPSRKQRKKKWPNEGETSPLL